MDHKASSVTTKMHLLTRRSLHSNVVTSFNVDLTFSLLHKGIGLTAKACEPSAIYDNIQLKPRGGGGIEGIDELNISKLCKTFGRGTNQELLIPNLRQRR